MVIQIKSDLDFLEDLHHTIVAYLPDTKYKH